jgi:hypothetical protein
LQNGALFKPVAHIWVKSALPWVTIPEGVAKYETQPDDPKELIRLWQAQRGVLGPAAT